MAKHKSDELEIEEFERALKEKTLEEMTDSEFLSGVDEWSAPLYIDYLSAPRNSETSVSGYLSATKIGILAKNVKKPVKGAESSQKDTQKSNKKYIKKRMAALIAIAVFCFIMLAATAIGFAEVEPISDYVLMYERSDGIGILDPAISMVTYLANLDLDPNFIVYFNGARTPYELIAPYAVACASILYLVCIILMFIKAFVAMFEKRTVCGYYVKRKFGFMSVVSILCALICVIGGLYVSGGQISQIAGFIVGEGRNFEMGYGLYAMIIVPIVTLILSSFAYGKKRR